MTAPVLPPRQIFWTRRRVKSLVVQAVFLGGLAWLFYFLFANTTANLQRQGIASGFGFLSQRAGFDVSLSFLPFTSDSSYGRAFWVAVVNALVLSALGIVLATVLGFGLGLARVSKNWLIARLATVYIEIFRNIPLLLQLFFWYFAILRQLPGPKESLVLADLVILNNRGLYMPRPQVDQSGWVIMVCFAAGLCMALVMTLRARQQRLKTGHGPKCWFWWPIGLFALPLTAYVLSGASLSFVIPELRGFNYRGGMLMLPEMLAALLGLGFYISAAIGEIVRSGIQGVDRGQVEAASALGLGRRDIMRLVVLPQAMRIIIPPLATQYLSLAKNTSLAAAIAFPEIISIVAGTTLTQTGQALEAITLAMLFYMSVSLSIAAVMNFLNYRVLRHGN
ncbi:ABC transporter permease subunit [Pseudotabrizicola sediminis]|uniref:ABC transporter permease subunit n=1 Tax=Pseudotabrizicola sediminis TaxID=2486418 RepID=A0ABY2KKS5_9RHOB|nr:ABC transporter permease subunit [Pseudotabrizicola sediminis]TGD42639.1 ABC transporter permease subunit [Pseudotabrizicola sediminis]